jgi:hypothetical protein
MRVSRFAPADFFAFWVLVKPAPELKTPAKRTPLDLGIQRGTKASAAIPGPARSCQP